ncbi:hypothetical protein [Streptomyces albus]|uniref:hypothetical protein n=1 Tax=Streptomyces albus TaxID=1888 RepID=UPI0006E43CA6|nr:hypothetical protein [Streptomyces albus]
MIGQPLRLGHQSDGQGLRFAAEDAGAVSGLLNTAKQFGGALGLAALSAVAGPDGAAYGRVFAAMTLTLAVIAVLALALPRPRQPRAPAAGAVSR